MAGPPATSPRLTFADLPGWSREDHLAALRAFQTGCGVARDPGLRAACLRARSVTILDETGARGFWEAEFIPSRVGDGGLLTGYFAPDYEASDHRSPPFTAAVRSKPADLVTLDLGLFDPERLRLRGHRIDDFEACAAMWGDPAVTRFIGVSSSRPTQTARRSNRRPRRTRSRG